MSTKTKVGVIGGGQLALMMAQEIKRKNLPLEMIVLDPSKNCPAAPFVKEVVIGSYKDQKQIDLLRKISDVVTYELEWTEPRALASDVEAGLAPVFPDANALSIIQDKFTQAKYFHSKGILVPITRALDIERDIYTFAKHHGLPVMVKVRNGSYDGKGNGVLVENRRENVNLLMERFGMKDGLVKNTLIAQQYVPFNTEISVIAARGLDGNTRIFPVAENIHGKKYNILQTTIVPARITPDIANQATEMAYQVLESLDTTGVFGIEMMVANGKVYLNEVAPRVHNTGHYTIEACETSQFEQHLRAITGMPLKSPHLKVLAAVMHNLNSLEHQSGLGGISYKGEFIQNDGEVEGGVFVHDYGKKDLGSKGSMRKMGHVTILSKDGESQDALIARAADIMRDFRTTPYSYGPSSR